MFLEVNVDPIKILGGLLSQRAGRPGAGSVMGQVLNGVASGARGREGMPVPPAGSLVEGLVRDSIMRHHHAGGQLPPAASTWVNGYPYGQVPQAVQPGFPPGQPCNFPPGYQQGFPPGYMPGYLPSNPPQGRPTPIPNQSVPNDPNYSPMTGGDGRGEILIQAMIMAAQADGQIDADEQNRILQALQPLTQAEVAYLNRAFATRHNLDAFVATIPRGMEHEVYQVTLMAINLNDPRELQYIRSLAQALRIEPHICNQYHAHYGLPDVF